MRRSNNKKVVIEYCKTYSEVQSTVSSSVVRIERQCDGPPPGTISITQLQGGHSHYPIWRRRQLGRQGYEVMFSVHPKHREGGRSSGASHLLPRYTSGLDYGADVFALEQ